MASNQRSRVDWMPWLPFAAAGAVLLALYLAAVLGIVDVPYLFLRGAVGLVGGLAVLKQLSGAGPSRRRELKGTLQRGHRIGLAAGLVFVVLAVIGGLVSE